MLVQNLETVGEIAWTHQVAQKFQGQGHSIKVKGHRAQEHANAHLPFMENLHTQFGDCSSNSQGAAGGTRVSRSRSRNMNSLMDGWTDRQMDRQIDILISMKEYHEGVIILAAFGLVVSGLEQAPLTISTLAWVLAFITQLVFLMNRNVKHLKPRWQASHVEIAHFHTSPFCMNCVSVMW